MTQTIKRKVSDDYLEMCEKSAIYADLTKLCGVDLEEGESLAEIVTYISKLDSTDEAVFLDILDQARESSKEEPGKVVNHPLSETLTATYINEDGDESFGIILNRTPVMACVRKKDEDVFKVVRVVKFNSSVLALTQLTNPYNS